MPRDYVDVLNGTFGDEQSAPPVAGLSFIFGGGVRLLDDFESHSERRIVVYPCAADAPDMEIAQGLMCALTWTLNTLDGATAVPLLIHDPTVEWTPSESTFGPDEFSPIGLGEDTVITSKLNRSASGIILNLTATTDVSDTDDLNLMLPAVDESSLLTTLLEAVRKISSWLGGSLGDVTTGEGQAKGSVAQAREWLAAAFAWHRAALSDAMHDRPLSLSSTSLRQLTMTSANIHTTGLTVRGIALATIWFANVDVETLIASVRELPHWQAAASPLSRALVELGATRLAVETLEESVEQAPEIPLNWLVLARLYLAMKQPELSVETLQDGIEVHSSYAPLLLQYGEALISIADQGIELAEVMYIEENREPAAAYEAIAAFQEAIKVLHGDQQAMAYVQLVDAAVRYEPDEIWPAFNELAALDQTGMYTELGLNAVAAQEDIDTALNGLEKAATRFPSESRVWRNLAYVRYLVGEMDDAADALEKALELAKDTKERGEYELLSLYAQDADAEAQLAEIADVVGSNNRIGDDGIELLEWIISDAPHYSEGYLLLSRAYVADGDDNAALECLLEAESHLGIEPDITVAIADLLLRSGEATVALDYITKGLEEFPRHVPLLTRAALVANALDDEDGARAFLRQAHNIAPYHREILRATRLMDADDYTD